MKNCKVCKVTKPFSNFRERKEMKDGYRNECKNCESKKSKRLRENNPEYLKDYYKKNNEKILSQKKEYRKTNRNKLNKYNKEYHKQKLLSNPLFKLRCNISRLIRFSIKRGGYSKISKTHILLGCSFEDLKVHLEGKFSKGMSWENIGKWHLNHIYPTSLAKNESELIRLNHYTNFQPLWAEDNLKKSNKIIQ